MGESAVERLAARFPGAKAEEVNGWPVLRVKPDLWHAAHAWLKGDRGFNYLSSLTAVHWIDDGEFEVASHLLRVESGQPLRDRISLRTRIPDVEGTAVPSLTDLWEAADWLERQAWDMFGIRFTGHPDLRRIWMWPGYNRHPLRKDFTDRAPNLGVSEETLRRDEEVSDAGAGR